MGNKMNVLLKHPHCKYNINNAFFSTHTLSKVIIKCLLGVITDI